MNIAIAGILESYVSEVPLDHDTGRLRSDEN